MKKTDNLELNIIEGTDIPNYATFNENVSKIDNAFATLNSKVENQETQNETFKNEVETEINNLKTDYVKFKEEVETLVSNVELNVNGVVKKGKLKRLVTKVTPNYTFENAYMPYIDSSTGEMVSVSEKRVGIRNYSATLNLNLTEQIGLTDVNDIMLLSAVTYSDEYVATTTGQINTLPMSCQGISKLTYPGAPDDLYITFRGNNTITYVQTYQGEFSGGWLPNPTPSMPISDVWIVVTYVEFE